MKTQQKKSKSRRATPWDGLNAENLAPMQEYLRTLYCKGNDDHHKTLAEINDAELFNAYVPDSCPYCRQHKFIKYGKYGTGLIRYKCKECGRSFEYSGVAGPPNPVDGTTPIPVAGATHSGNGDHSKIKMIQT